MTPDYRYYVVPSTQKAELVRSHDKRYELLVIGTSGSPTWVRNPYSGYLLLELRGREIDLWLEWLNKLEAVKV